MIEAEMIRSDTIISVEKLSKRYWIGHRVAGRTSPAFLREMIGRSARGLARKTADFVRGRQIVMGDHVEQFWALKDVSFEVSRGEVVGIIGRNGAGKSTLLKILSRITEPTQGRVRLRGRVSSLLEVGTGFHPELTGRENIFLNGAILGMRQQEVRRKFDEIVEFAGIEKFLDTPVKHYSSGMYVRLAFAVAAHLEPEVLIVDEVLAVGDARFQEKCLGKMSDVATRGRTVLFVSHNMTAVQSLCRRCLLLDGGHIAYEGSASECVRAYLHDNDTSLKGEWKRLDDGPPIFGFKRLKLSLTGRQPNITLRLDCSFAGELNGRRALVAFDISDSLRTPLMQVLPVATPFVADSRQDLRFEVALPPLVPGKYWITAWAGPHYTETFDLCSDCLSFEIDEPPTPNRSFPYSSGHGFVVPVCRYEGLGSGTARQGG